MGEGFIKLMRSRATRELLRDGNAFLLLTLIAWRAKRTSDFSVRGLRIGQALIGDYEACGLSRKQYRNAKVRLQRYGLARFERATNGTIATLLDTSVYDINDEHRRPLSGRREASEGPATGQPPATNKNDKNEKNGRGPILLTLRRIRRRSRRSNAPGPARRSSRPNGSSRPMTKLDFVQWFDAQVQPRWPTWPVNTCIIGDWYEVFGRYSPEPLTEAVRRHKICDDPARPKINAIRAILCARRSPHGPGTAEPSPSFFVECTEPLATNPNRLAVSIGIHVQPCPATHNRHALTTCAETIRQTHERLYRGRWIMTMQRPKC